MAKYYLEFSTQAEADLKALKKSGTPAERKKIEKILCELETHPRTGTGNPEMLKYNFAGYWSRRLNKKDRLIYKIDDDKIIVFILSSKGHY